MFHIDRNSTAQNMPRETLLSGKQEVGQSQHSNPGKVNQNQRFTAMASKFFDKKVPLKKKV